jgi:hypothetical protein
MLVSEKKIVVFPAWMMPDFWQAIPLSDRFLDFI